MKSAVFTCKRRVVKSRQASFHKIQGTIALSNNIKIIKLGHIRNRLSAQVENEAQF